MLGTKFLRISFSNFKGPAPMQRNFPCPDYSFIRKNSRNDRLSDFFHISSRSRIKDSNNTPVTSLRMANLHITKSPISLRLLDEIAWNFVRRYTRLKVITLCTFCDCHAVPSDFRLHNIKNVIVSSVVKLFGIILVGHICTHVFNLYK